MNEPQSVAAEKLALSILAGEKPDGTPLCRPSDLISLSLQSSTLWPIAPFSSLFGFEVPDGQIMIWTYISAYTSLADESSAAVDYGFNYDAKCQLQIQGASGNFSPRTGSILTQGLFNKPIFLVFEPMTTPRIILSPNSSTQASGNLRVEAEVTAFLTSAGLTSAFNTHQTKFS